MKKALLGAILSVFIAAVAHAGDVLSLKAGHPETYVVQKGDTLWKISATFLEDPWLWPELWHYNPQVDNPHLIYPGDILRLVWVDGAPRLVKVIQSGGGGAVKLSPKMRISDLDEAIPTIPLDVIGPFLNQSRVVNDGVLEKAPYVLIGKEGHLIAGAANEIYARGEFADDKVFGIYRRGKVFTDPDTGEALGIEARDIGNGRLLAVDKDIGTVLLNKTNEEIRRGDRLLPQEDRNLRARFEPRAPDRDMKGYIIAVEGGVSQVGHMSVVVLNRGERDGLQPGHVMAVYQTGELVRDDVADEIVRVPDLRSGILMVFRSFDKVSYAVILKAERALRVGDRVENP